MTNPNDPREPYASNQDPVDQAREMGREAGRRAATWAADGLASDVEHAHKVLGMLAADDPEAGTLLPARPSLSGEWADGETPASLYAQVVGGEEEADQDPEMVDAIANAWEEGVSEVFEDACTAELRMALPDSPSTSPQTTN